MTPTQAAASEAASDRPVLTRTYLLVLVVELIVLAGLVWLGRHFG